MLSRRIRSVSAAALALTGAAVLAPSAQAAPPAPGWRVSHQFKDPDRVPRLYGVAASDTRSAWVVGNFPQSVDPASYRWSGRRWRPAGITANQVSFLNTVSTSGPTNTWAFGDKGTNIGNGASRSLHWDGHRWATADLPKVGSARPRIASSVTLGPKDTWAFGGLDGAGSPYIGHFTGKLWKQIAAPVKAQPGYISTAVALSGKNIWALAGYQDNSYNLLHYDGRSWTIVKTPANFFTHAKGMVVRSKNDIWLPGWRPATTTHPAQPGAMHYNGKKWSFVPVSTSRPELVSVADDGQGGLWALTIYSPSELWHYVNGHWSKVTLANNADITGLAHIPGSSTTLGVGSDSSGPAIFVTGRF